MHENEILTQNLHELDNNNNFMHEIVRCPITHSGAKKIPGAKLSCIEIAFSWMTTSFSCTEISYFHA